MELKSATSFSEQALLLKNRGCFVDDMDECIEFLKKVNYYRFTAYALPFRNQDQTYVEGTSFRKIKSIYEFDKNMRAFILAAVEDAEICIRTKLAYYHGHTYGARGYWDKSNFNSHHQHDRFIDMVENEIKRNKKALWVRHHISNYDGKFPIWVIIELFSLGMLSRFYEDLILKDRKQIAIEYRTKDIYLKSWLRSLTVIRNICAHYGRLYYSMFTNIPKLPSILGVPPTGMLFDQLLALKFLMPCNDIWENVHMPILTSLLNTYSSFIDLEHIGFPYDWSEKLKKPFSTI